MFDLNVDLYSTCDELETKIPMEKPTEGNDCNRTSISLSNGISLLSFGILSKGKSRKTKIEDDCNENSPPVLVTRQLFAMAGGGGGGVGDSEESLLRPQGLNLSFSDAARGGSEFRKFQQKNQKMKKSRRGPKSRSSEYRGVTFYRRTGRWESHIWDCGKQLYLGSFDTPLAAARVFDRAAIKFRGVDADINFNVCDYEEDMDKMNKLSKEEFLRLVRRRSTEFSRGSSKNGGVTLHECGRWDTCTGQFLGKKFIYVPCSFYFNTEVKAARAYDKATINCNAREVAFTNFEASASDTEMSMNAKNLGRSTAQSLDLNLCISPPTNVSACNPSF